MLPQPISFALCAHVYEKTNSFYILEKIASQVANITGKETRLRTFRDFLEEKTSKEEFHIYYANPELALKLLNRGYIMLGKLKDEQCTAYRIVSESYNPSKKLIKVALIDNKFFLLPLAIHIKEYKNFHLIFAKSYKEIVELIKKDKADIGIIYSDSVDDLIDDKNLKIYPDFSFHIPHLILLHPYLQDYKDKILSIKDIEELSSYELDGILKLDKELNMLLDDWGHHDIVDVLVNSLNIGIIIYDEKILFINEYVKTLLNYPEERLYSISILDLLHQQDKKLLTDSNHRRIKGERFPENYELRIFKDDGSLLYVNSIVNTILYKGKYTGLMVFYDITSKKFSENTKTIIGQVNKIVTQSLTEEEIYDGICSSLIENLGLRFAWVGMLNDNKKITPKFFKGTDQKLTETIYEIFQNTSSSYTSVSGEVEITPDLRKQVEKNSYIDELIKKGIMSSCVIPLSKYGKVVSLLNIYSDFVNFFNDSIKDLLSEIQRDLSFALERVERIRHNTIISEALKNSDTWILVTDEKGEIIFVNEAVEKISGYKKEELIGKNPNIFKSGLNPPEFYKEMWDTILRGEIFNAITPNRVKNGEIFHADLKIIPVNLPGDIKRFVAVAKDITEKLRLSEKVQRLQNYDALTELLNMSGFSAFVSQRLNQSKNFGLLVLIDIYEMTYINKIYGISIGDRVLVEVGKNLKKIFDYTEAIARIGADTFGVYIVSEDYDEIYKVYLKLHALNGLLLSIEDKAITIDINAAISIHPKDGEGFKTLYERADITLQRAKKEGQGIIKFFDPEIEKDSEKLWNMFNLVKKAITEKLFSFYYQPYYYTHSLQVAGLEALIRIIERDGRVFTPNFFIDYLENSQYLKVFENWAIREVSDKIKRWQLGISLNISGKTFNDPNFVKLISDIPVEIRNSLTIEITERLFIDKPKLAMKILEEIKSIENPPKIAMDDFGTGYSSLVYLKDLAIDIIKIDRAFIKEMLYDKKSLSIIQTIIDLAQRLEKITLAEGIETEEQYNILKSFGCDLVQGFIFSKPLPEENVSSIYLEKK
ncbi:MAG: EAL domain-containing protein [Thermodesulfovibrionales bacterium]|nr:EAL domain-containing protein [Thermodesulfovibrionales bacterium]